MGTMTLHDLPWFLQGGFGGLLPWFPADGGKTKDVEEAGFYAEQVLDRQRNTHAPELMTDNEVLDYMNRHRLSSPFPHDQQWLLKQRRKAGGPPVYCWQEDATALTCRWALEIWLRKNRQPRG
ncbi:hypothetical protein [Ruegeria sp. HKCCA5426]|uniref:hypothetical protein n=1 Tax=Ruegeria sp. HKCCA5426 TaxID=2682985 RepID=UPI001488B381|nr:hypothetical protein [Ruegeria sp. HKCCA5426]